jgi:hypothetical protein
MARRDIYAVKERGNGFDFWTYRYMSRSPETAKRQARCCSPMLGYRHEVKIVHPPQHAVDAFVACGNMIED